MELHQRVENNKALMSKEKKAAGKTCVICLEDMKGKCETKLDCCSHTYCNSCIKEWITMDPRKRCPLCKERIKELSWKDASGKEKSYEVPNPVNMYSDSDYDSEDGHDLCDRCIDLISPTDFETG